ncbi:MULTISPECIES: gluconate 2-dehydrogenase subunit 3 family protein [Dyadobacter]|uniref:Gluconate 2-dehydrogenase subunit 3 family protein n=1 Tax=Dyadobacter chenhuakuii TaxID=2909339 RepID=A0A9X1TZA4_9BACT|nr:MULTISPECIES: gluconate 2-dehydrogenase subunit 3 family protein [Dyadobacter]MCE7070241.1 gluconate 2-dehydrogenase subunit 3 family protein [Dyadobacter sp. CY327]MCF2492539.1 gluconate 2-dehydrogenase subunit 3 family protein [Dyadobacter chenhuakuii]MCF2497051.1 gluconate 2-dehydrogenase subunit 3 family protein [Dyadobacter chenhuakuii]USJ33164.1 gluconate 2-dehydrogenase subunit 3 family protein [Dyadobacter chenhuakuii]
MNRREAVQKITFLLGGTLSAPLMAGIMGEKLNFGPSLDISAEQEALLADVADTIIPTTGTPGAKAAGADKFITRIMRDCYEMADQKKFYSGLDKIDAQSKEVYSKGFSALDATQKNDIIKRTTVSDKPFFLQMKGLTVTGYFTSEIGATQALDYLPIPGRFDGSWPMPKGQKSWAL